MDGKSEKGRRNHGEGLATLPPDQSTEAWLPHSPSLLGLSSGTGHFIWGARYRVKLGAILLRVGPLAVCIRVIMLARAMSCHEMVQTVDVSMIWAEAMTVGQN